VCSRHGLHLTCETQRLLAASALRAVRNCLHKGYKKGKGHFLLTRLYCFLLYFNKYLLLLKFYPYAPNTDILRSTIYISKSIYLNTITLFFIQCLRFYNNNNNQAFYSQANWDRLEMKSHEQKKTGTKQERKRRGKTNGDKKTKSKKGQKTIKR
jgi:hypothetical protein